jgi:WD40 repeat protein
MGENTGGHFRYRAFISYSRADRDVTQRLHRLLERYVLPATLRIVSLGMRRDARPLKPVFLDESEIVPGPSLSGRIRGALRLSEFLIVVCSPRSAASAWVEKEIVDFVRLGRRENILAVVVDGTPNAVAKGRPAAAEALPKALRFEIAEDGAITDVPAEPLWIDWRGEARRGRAGFLRIVAALLSLGSLDDLIRRDAARQRRRLIAAIAASAASLLLAFVGIHYALAEESQSLAVAAEVAYAANDGPKALALSRLALPSRIAELFGVHSTEAEAIAVKASFSNRLIQELAPPGTHSLLTAPSGDRLLSVSDENQAAIYRFDRGDVAIARFALRGDTTPFAAFCGNGKYLATESPDWMISIWRTDGSAEPHVATLPGVVLAGEAFSADCARVVMGGPDLSTLEVWDVRAWRKLAALPLPGKTFLSASLSPDGKSVLGIPSESAAPAMFDVASGTLLRRLEVERGDTVKYPRFSADGRLIFDTDPTGSPLLWSSATGKRLRQLDSKVWPNGGQYLVSPDGSKIALLFSLKKSGNTDDSMIYSTKGGAPAVIPREDASVLSAAFSQDARRLIVGYDNQTAAVYDGSDGTKLMTLRARGPVIRVALPGPGGDTAVTDDGMSARRWNIGTINLSATREVSRTPMQLKPAEGGLLCVSDDVSVESVDPGRSAVRPMASISAGYIRDVRLRDGVLTGAVSVPPDIVLVRDMSHGRNLLTLHGGHGWVDSAAFSQDGSLVAAGSEDGSIRVWNAADGTLVDQLDASDGAGAVEVLHFSASGRYLLSGSDENTAHSWEFATKHLVKYQGFTGAVTALAASPDESTLAVGSADTTVWVWDIASGALRGTLDGHTQKISAVAFSPDGARILTASRDGTVRFWDGRTLRFLGSVEDGDSALNDAAFLPGGRMIVTAADKVLKFWHSPPAGSGSGLARELCAAAPSAFVGLDDHDIPAMSVLGPSPAELAHPC